MGILNKPIEYLVKLFVNKSIKGYGEMINFNIDSKKKNISLEILLKGEKETITVNLMGYKVIRNADSSYVQFNDVSASREWIDNLIHNVVIPNYTPDNQIEIDGKYATIINLLI